MGWESSGTYSLLLHTRGENTPHYFASSSELRPQKNHIKGKLLMQFFLNLQFEFHFISPVFTKPSELHSLHTRPLIIPLSVQTYFLSSSIRAYSNQDRRPFNSSTTPFCPYPPFSPKIPPPWTRQANGFVDGAARARWVLSSTSIASSATGKKIFTPTQTLLLSLLLNARPAFAFRIQSCSLWSARRRTHPLEIETGKSDFRSQQDREIWFRFQHYSMRSFNEWPNLINLRLCVCTYWDKR